MIDYFRQLVQEEEDCKLQPYYDSKGFATAMWGRLCDPRRKCPFPQSIADQVLELDLAGSRALAMRVPGYERLNEIQRAALGSMIYQMGFEPFDGDGHQDFKNLLACLKAGDLQGVKREMLDSKWARTDSPKRALREANMMGSGLWVPKI